MPGQCDWKVNYKCKYNVIFCSHSSSVQQKITTPGLPFTTIPGRRKIEIPNHYSLKGFHNQQ